MHASTALALISATSLAVATPLQSRAVAKFAPGVLWDVVYDSSKVTLEQLKGANGTVIDIDLLGRVAEEGNTDIAQLAETKQVICYFSAGSREDWRADADDFAPSDYGRGLANGEDGEEWPGENWLNVRSNNVRAIIKRRIESAAKAGCDAVEPDNVDGYNNDQDGFGYPRSAYVDYIKWMAGIAHANNLAIGLKNGIEMIGDLVAVVDFAVNEECHNPQWDECGEYKPFTSAGKAVFHIEYETDNCSDPPGVNLSTLLKPWDLDVIGETRQCD